MNHLEDAMNTLEAWRYEIAGSRYSAIYNLETGIVEHNSDIAHRYPYIVPPLKFDTDMEKTLTPSYGHGPGSVICQKVSLGVGVYYPRMWRQDTVPGLNEIFNRDFLSTIQAVHGLNVAAAQIHSFVEPHLENDNTFSHQIRQCLILACTEVENAWASILQSNGVIGAGRKGEYTTKDYVKLLAPLKLAEWEVGLANYPEYSNFKPFEGWDASCATQSLSWYDAYNKVKHGRELNFREATMKNMLHALGAVHVLTEAQFGPRGSYLYDRSYPDPFKTVSKPTWLLSEEYVASCTEPRIWRKQNYPFV